MKTVKEVIKEMIDEMVALDLGGLKYLNLYKEVVKKEGCYENLN